MNERVQRYAHTETCACGSQCSGWSDIDEMNARADFIGVAVELGWQLVEPGPDSSALRWVCPSCFAETSDPAAFDFATAIRGRSLGAREDG